MSQSFDEMSSDEQVRWWQHQAMEAYNALNLPEATLLLVSYTHHAVFKVLLDDKTLILKLALPEYDAQLKSEYDVLAQLSEAELGVARPINYLRLESCSAILMTYVSGETRNGDDVTQVDMSRIGEFLADFHAIDTDNLSLIKRLDWNGLYSENGVYYPNEQDKSIFTQQQWTVIQEVTDNVKSAMDELGQDTNEFGLIHGDLLLKNLLFGQSQIHALDFEYCGWGYYLYDLTPILWQLKPHENYAQLEEALWTGYTSKRPLSDHRRALLETFIAGRQVASMFWIASNQQNPHVVGKVESILAQRTNELSHFLKTGKLERH